MEGQVYKFEVSRRETGNLALEPIKNGQQACEFCFKHLDGLIKEWRETSAAIYLDKENRALGYEIISEGTADACLFDTKQLIRSACLVGANSVIVAHNHPSGNARPSKLDIEQAEKIRRGLHAAGLILLDFVILTESGEGYTMCDERVIKCEIAPENGQEKHKEQKPAEWSDVDEDMFNAICYCASTKLPFQPEHLTWLNNRVKRLHPQPHWKPSEQEKCALRTAIHVLTEERNFPKAAEHLQAILDAFDKETRKEWKPNEEQMEALEHFIRSWGESGTMSPQNTILCAANSLLTDLQKLL